MQLCGCRLNPNSRQGCVNAGMGRNPHATKRPILLLSHNSSSPHTQTEHCDDSGHRALRIRNCWKAGGLSFPLAGFCQISPAHASERPEIQSRTGNTQEGFAPELLGGSCLLESSIQSFSCRALAPLVCTKEKRPTSIRKFRSFNSDKPDNHSVRIEFYECV